MNQAQQTNPAPTTTEDDVARYLAEHPDFFDAFPQLLETLALQHPSGSAVSLIERQVQALRRQHRQAEQKLAKLVELARDNDRLGNKMHALVLALLDRDSLAATVRCAIEHLSGAFEADEVALQLFSDRVVGPEAEGVHWLGSDDPELREFENILNSRNPICGRLTARQLENLFGPAGERVGSAVVIPLATHTAFGLLAIGSHDADRYQHGMGTVFLQQLGELIAHATLRYMELSETRQTGKEAE